MSPCRSGTNLNKLNSRDRHSRACFVLLTFKRLNPAATLPTQLFHCSSTPIRFSLDQEEANEDDYRTYGSWS